jgi:cellulose synthase/poly-beta-1,6-N-acetylglucosamine synthase-like glycosyltransferase
MTAPWFWMAAGPAIVLALAGLVRQARRLAYVRKRLRDRPGSLPPASVIVPLKGADQGLRENLAALAAQDYPDYELIVTARTAWDIPGGVLPARVKVVVGRADDPHTSEKIQNLVAGVKATRKRTEVLAFADSDGQVGPGWLRALAGALDDPGAGASTGYRWHTPEPARFWPLLGGLWDAVIAGSLGPGANYFAWGGSMAIRKETFFEVHVFERWKGAVSDDYELSAAVRRAGLRIVFAPGAMAATPGGDSARGFLEWACRQMRLTRVYRPGLWWMALLSHFVYCAGMAWAAAALVAHPVPAAAALAAQLVPGMTIGALRARSACLELPARRAWFRRHGWAHALGAPVTTWAWLVVLLVSAAGSTIEWRGRRYVLRRRP